MPVDAPLTTFDAVVLAADTNGLGAIRCLARRGLQLVSIAESPADISGYSRFPKQKYSLTKTTDAEREQQLLNLLERVPGKDLVLIPTSDWFVAAIAKHRQILSDRFRFCIPSTEIVDLLLDKAQETRRISQIIALPNTVQELPESSEELLSALALPIIIKPRSHENMVLGQKNIRLFTEDDVASFYREFGNLREHLLAQEIIEGDDTLQFVCNCFFDANSDLAQAFTFRRLRLSPSHYGVTSYAISARNQAVVDRSAKLGKKLGYVGPAMIEFKLDLRDGEYKYIELNPRLGMCNYFDASCGVDNVYATYLCAKGRGLVPSGEMKSDVMFLSFYADLYSRYKDGEKPFEILRDYISHSSQRHVFSYFAWRDPAPALVETWRQSKAVSLSLARKLKRRMLDVT